MMILKETKKERDISCFDNKRLGSFYFVNSYAKSILLSFVESS